MPAVMPVEGERTRDVLAEAGFAAPQPLVLDLGCGNGVFLSGLAAEQPGWNVLGIEKKNYRVRQARRRAENLENARVVHGEVTEILSALPAASVSRVYLLFSDPWPKRRHAVRRLVQDDFVSLLGSRLAAEGIVFFASDSAEYSMWAEEIFRSGGWQLSGWDLPRDWPPTEFEQRFVLAGVSIRRFQAIR